jgi:hypothetical protein
MNLMIQSSKRCSVTKITTADINHHLHLVTDLWYISHASPTGSVSSHVLTILNILKEVFHESFTTSGGILLFD